MYQSILAERERQQSTQYQFSPSSSYTDLRTVSDIVSGANKTMNTMSSSHNRVGAFNASECASLRQCEDLYGVLLYYLPKGDYVAISVLLRTLHHREEEEEAGKEWMSEEKYLLTLEDYLPDALPPSKYHKIVPGGVEYPWRINHTMNDVSTKKMSKMVVWCDWYRKQARNMEERSGQLMHALSLVDIGLRVLSTMAPVVVAAAAKNENDTDMEKEKEKEKERLFEMCSLDVCGTEERKERKEDDTTVTSTTADPSDSLDQLHLLHGRLHFLHGVVYSSHAFTSFNDNHHNQGFTSSTSTTTTLSNMNWTLTSFEHMTTQQRLSTLLSHASPDTVVTTLRIHVRPLMGKSRQSMCLKTWTQALHLYCVKSAQKTTPDGLRIAGTWCCAVCLFLVFIYYSYLPICSCYSSTVCGCAVCFHFLVFGIRYTLFFSNHI